MDVHRVVGEHEPYPLVLAQGLAEGSAPPRVIGGDVGADRADPDAVWRHLARQVPGQGDDRQLAGAGAGEMGVASLAGPSSEVDDRARALRDHVRQNCSADNKDAFDIDPQHCLQHVERHIERRTGPGDPGIVDQHIDLVETKIPLARRAVGRLGSAGQPMRIQHFLYPEGAVLREVTLG